MGVRLKLEGDLLAHVEGALDAVAIHLFLETRLGARESDTQQLRVHCPVDLVERRICG